MLGVRLIHVPLDSKTLEVDIFQVWCALTPYTIMIYASAPSYPHGVIDPISKLGNLAKQYGISLHVDCCLGGFILPFAKQMGYKIPGARSTAV
jgi:sphinganine-1-phosphate aldolase